MNQHAPDSRPRLTAKQGQYLAFIHAYRRLLGQSPAEADMQRFFQVTSPSVHQMVLSLEKAGLITRQPGIARSITLTIDPADLPELASRYDQPVKIAASRVLGIGGLGGIGPPQKAARVSPTGSRSPRQLRHSRRSHL